MRQQTDAETFLGKLEPESVGLLITDPPWALQGGSRFTDATGYQLMPVDEIVKALRPARKALRPGAHAYFFVPCGDELREFMAYMEQDGWKFQRVLCWEKGQAGLGAYQNAFEPVLIYSNGKAGRYRANGQFKSLQKWPRPAGRTAKPWQLYKVFMEMSSLPGDLVVDPFCGTNPLQKAAQVLTPRRRWASADLEPESAVRGQVRTADRTSKGRVAANKAAVDAGAGQALLFEPRREKDDERGPA